MRAAAVTVIQFLGCSHKLEVKQSQGETIPRTIHQSQAIICKECSKEARKATDGKVQTVRRFWRFA